MRASAFRLSLSFALFIVLASVLPLEAASSGKKPKQPPAPPKETEAKEKKAPAAGQMEFTNWNLRLPEKAKSLEAKLGLKYTGPETVDLIGVRLRFCQYDGTEQGQSKWVAAKGMGPGAERTLSVTAPPPAKLEAVWIDVRYYLQDASSGESSKTGRDRIAEGLDEEIDQEKLDTINELFFAFGAETPQRYTLENMKIAEERLNRRLQGVVEKAEEETAAPAAEIQPGVLNIMDMTIEPEKGGTSTLVVKLHNDAQEFEANRVTLIVTLERDDAPDRIVQHLIPAPLPKGPASVRIPGQRTEGVTNWQAACAY